MAGGEIYRVEIPIIVDDQSEAPLTKARERVNKFEQAAQKTNQSIQRMAMTDYRLRLSVLDRAMPAIDKVGRTLKTMTTRAWTFTIGVKDKVTGFLGRIGRMLTTPLGMIGMGGMTLGPMALIGGAIKIAGEFEQAMANVQSVAGASREEMDRLREAAAKAGRETVFKASEAADALYYLALAGFDVNQQIGALSGTLALAAATQSDLAFTSETIASTISAFGLQAEEADRVSNVFAATISSSQASMDKLATSMRYAGPAAAGFNRSLEETAATLALFYNMGLTGEMAGTRFRTALSALAHPTGDTKKALAELGIKASQVNPAMHSLADIIDLLKDKGVDTAMAMRIFGQETGPAMASLIALGGNALRDMERQITGTNKALEMQEIQLGTLVGAQKELQSVWEAVNITLGTQSIPGLRRLVEWFRQAIGNAEELAKSIGDKLNRAFEWLVDILESPEFKEATFADKIKILFTAAIDEISTWLGSSGKEQLSKVFMTLGEESVKAYIAGMKSLGQRAIQELKQGNVVGAAVPAAAMWLLGGGALARGVWRLGKGLFGVGKWALGKAVGTAAATGTTAAATTAAATTAATAATAAGTKLIYGPSGEILQAVTPAATAAGKVGIASRVLPILGRARPWLGRIGLPIAAGLEAINIARAEDKKTAAILGTGRIAGMIAGGKAGAVAGGAIGGLFGGVGAAPGTVIGSILGGIGGLFGGEMIAEKINAWLDKVDFKALKEKALLMWNDVRQKASDTWKNVTAWTSGAWEEARKSASSAWNWIKENFTLESITEKAGYVVGYLESTIFSSEWWGRQWDGVKNWASEKWAGMVEVYESTKATIMSTIFSSEWWKGHWDAVKGWTAEKWTGMVEIWENTKENLSSTLFSSEWWQGHWESVAGWTSEKWDEMKTVWENAKEAISSALFSKDWWGRQWGSVKSWASNALSGIVSRWESLKASFAVGREAGQRAAVTKHAIGGILTRPHLGLVAETGPEAIIPLSVGMRSRALGLWEEAGKRLGVSAAIPAPAGQMFEERRAVTPAGEPLFSGTELRAMPKRAIGGIFSRPYTALVAEAGPEAIIPLAKPERAWGLWQQVGDRRGFFGREKVIYNVPTKLMQQRMTYNVSNPTPNIQNMQTATITRGMSDSLDKLQNVTRLIISRRQESVSKMTSIVERIRNTQTGLAAEVNNYSGPTSYQPLVKTAATKFNIPAGILARPIQAESGWQPSAVSPVGAFGLTQVMPGTAQSMGYSLAELRCSPVLQIEAGARYLSQQYQQFNKSWPLVLAAYNAGPGAVAKYDGIPPYRETQNYVSKILSPTRYAEGGILTRPHLGLVAEAGPEAIIPLSARMRPRALELWQQTGELLGVMPELPKLTGQAVINPVLGLTPRLTQLIGNVAYKASVIVPRFQKIFGSAVIESAFGFLPRLSELTGQAVITGDKDISENIQYVTHVSETGKRFANVIEMEQYQNLERLKNDVIRDNIQRVTDVSETTKKIADVVDIEKYQRLIDEVAYPANINEPQLRTLPGKVLVKSELNDVLQKPILSKLSLYNRVDETQDKTISKNIQQTTEAIETTRKFVDIIGIEQYRTLKRMINDISHYIQQKANISETTRRLTNVIDIEQYRNLKTRNNTINENQMQFITTANKIQTVKAYATGGILTKPHIGLVAEAGPEVIIPLSTRMRARALELYEKTGRMLGVRPYAEGGFAGALTQNREQKIPVSLTPSLAVPGPATVNLNFDLAGLVSQVVIESREDIDGAVDRITDAIANNLRSVFQNMTK